MENAIQILAIHTMIAMPLLVHANQTIIVALEHVAIQKI